MKSSPRVAVTGMGAVSAVGNNCAEFLQALRAGRCGIRPLTRLETEGCASNIGGEVPRLPDPPFGFPRRHSRSDRFCLVAASEALAQARLEPGAALSTFGVSVGSSTAGMREGEQAYLEAGERGWGRAPVSSFLSVPTHAPADALARYLGLRGPRLGNMTSCCSASLSIGLAADLIRNGDVEGVIAGGADALCRLTYSGFNSLRLVSSRPCRPFDSERDGMSLGEGAGMLVLENWDRAVARGAEPLAEFLDYGTSCDAYHSTASHPEGRGAVAAMRQALVRSGLATGDVDYINAHGTGTPSNDAAEVRAFQELFGEQLKRIPISSTKSQVGHLLGGAGGIEAVTVILALRHEFVPPTLDLLQPEAGGEIDFVPGHSVVKSLDVAMSNSFGFGGANACLVFRRAVPS